ncbi:hypothetical protein HDE_01562 [Halotydeus destructor]|nr:hypothetical protein HDE_01562 [Halotydeus destructor]
MTLLTVVSLTSFAIVCASHSTSDPYAQYRYDPYKYYRPSSYYSSYNQPRQSYSGSYANSPSTMSYVTSSSYSSPTYKVTSYPLPYRQPSRSWSTGNGYSAGNRYSTYPSYSSSSYYPQSYSNYGSLNYIPGTGTGHYNPSGYGSHGQATDQTQNDPIRLYSWSSRTQRTGDQAEKPSVPEKVTEDKVKVKMDASNMASDIPKFLGRGAFEVNNNKLIITCKLTVPNYDTLAPIEWVRISGPYEVSTSGDLPYVCPTSGCSYDFVSASSSKHKIVNDKDLSFLIINQPKEDDQGFYRCSSVQSSTEDGHNQTFYQIIRVGN